MYRHLKQYFAKYVSVSESELTDFCQLFEQKTIKKKQFLLEKGEICKFEAFVIKGLFKTYHIDSKGNEQILQFAEADWWLTDFDSFDNQSPSQLSIQALEDSEILFISYKNKEYAFKKWQFTERLFRIMTKKTHIALQRRMIDNLSKTAQERYWDFLNKYPKIANRLSNIQIARYLGVTHEFVSKIRAKATKK
ncbi:Crp/Fnr family transcriptional regulator [Capnocytophaga sp.]|uniref:Crp/Fnr family transcriptional regulator n=1 Tax=Capnocytophaga sp. TaxID=44737 RepID=UPI0026DD55E4|nr:Crp/Fnr family transcriptional regulator [Capnocytophaga sp.]MDO5105220.1 Crp/Fnr family transcriptional regulator [Capnocytophaga sp.]